jgi:cation transport regulator ChaC
MDRQHNGQMVFNATCNNISVLLVAETGVPGENHRHIASHWQTLSHYIYDHDHDDPDQYIQDTKMVR